MKNPQPAYPQRLCALHPDYYWTVQLPLPGLFRFPPIYNIEGPEDVERQGSPSSTPPKPKKRRRP